MSPPRVRITVGNLFVVVAVAALNCEIARRFYPKLATTRPYHLAWGDQLEVMVGLWPLLNVGLIAALLLFRRKLQSSHHEPRDRDRPVPPGFTYFVVHFLALGGLACYLMPDLFGNYLSYIDQGDILGERMFPRIDLEKTHPQWWLSLRCVALGLAFSGPPVLLSWVGGMLARRSASTLPRRRFLATTVLVSLCYAGAGLAIAVTPQPFTENHFEVGLDLRIVDEDTGKPVATSFVLINHAFFPDAIPTRTLTGPDGRAQLTPSLAASGMRNSFRTMGTFESWGRWIEVTAPGYRPLRTSLTEVLGPLVDFERPRVWRIALTCGEARDDPFDAVAGTYSTFWTQFKVERDGRFTYSKSEGCFGHSTLEYGHLAKLGDELALIPIPSPDDGIDPLMPTRLRMIPWGERLYVCTTDDHSLANYCRAGLGIENGNVLEMSRLSRVSDREKPRRGLPRLPLSVWARFALGEISPLNREGSLRVALESLGSKPQ